MSVRSAAQILADIAASGVPDDDKADLNGLAFATMDETALVDTEMVRAAYGLTRRRVSDFVVEGRLVPVLRGQGRHRHQFTVAHVREALGESLWDVHA